MSGALLALVLAAPLVQVAPPIDTTGFSGEQKFWLAIAQILVPVVLGLLTLAGSLVAVWQSRQAARKVDANTALTAATQAEVAETSRKADRNSQQVQELAVNVDGRLKQLLAEKDDRAAAATRAAHAEGKLEGLREAAPAGPVVVEPVVVQTGGTGPTGAPAPGRQGRRATDPEIGPAPPADPTAPRDGALD